MTKIIKIPITTTITKEDFDWIKKRGLKVSNLLSSAVSIDKTNFETCDGKDIINHLKRKIGIIQKKLQIAIDFINKKGLFEELKEYDINNEI